MHSLKAAALRYAAEWPVFILGRNKRPVANCPPCRAADPKQHDPQGCRCLTCHGFYAATRDPKAIVRMLAMEPNGMLAIRTGAPSGLVVVDVDPRNGGSQTIKTLVAQGLLPPTRFAATGSGGLHLYYRHPGPHTKIPSGPNVLGPGIDIKADGGYVIAPPSIHPHTRQPYVWADESTPVSEMPLALRTALTPAVTAANPALAPAPKPRLARAGGISSPAALLEAHLATVRNAPEGKRRTTLYGASRGVARMAASGAISPADAQAALMAVGLAAGQTERDSRAAISGGFRDEGVTL
ncbi:bifunctional DNA primase/polymerase [Catelliglobosispora koreensis]|uniref:bifunctional DNA primase/polymerase n=1 Tax=Catelliglobosispora koreensis TaxID=129052 RepID=UPI00036F4E90|nr:bifunctional DNA primase/polymerase [Catelliglobosispora koreensis]